MAGTTPVWKRLVEEGWFATRDEAARWILAGKVRADGRPVLTAGQRVPPAAALSVRGQDFPYVAKGGLKLHAALESFGVDAAGRVCIDAGASAGGFTDCLIRHGAALVYAVDVGYGQLAGSLRVNPAVINLERTNIGDASLLSLRPHPTLGTVDLSYLSLRLAVPQFAPILRGRGELVCLVKPLFEVDDALARRTGVMQPEAYAPVLCGLCADMRAAGRAVRGLMSSPVTGNGGTLEFFMHLSLEGTGGMDGQDCERAARAAVEAALALAPYQRGK